MRVEVGPFACIYDPSVGEAERWYINDHCFVEGPDGRWHMFGITHAEPAAPLDERFLAHAVAPDPRGPWTKLPPVMHADAAVGETHVWAPHVVREGELYWMFYCAGGDAHERYRIHAATSPDLFAWTRVDANPLIVDGFDARDPMLLRAGGAWVMYYTATSAPDGGHHVVKAATSRDLVRWSEPREVFRSSATGTYGGPTESPFVVRRAGAWLLFVCTNRGYNETAVYASASPFAWREADLIGTFPAHAAEVVELAGGGWLVSHAGWGQGGLYLADLTWVD
jgi:hypothetical protein